MTMVAYEYIPEEDIYIIQEELPEGAEGFCKEVGCYRYAVINCALDEDTKRKVIEHEFRHLKNNDLERDFDELSIL